MTTYRGVDAEFLSWAMSQATDPRFNTEGLGYNMVIGTWVNVTKRLTEERADKLLAVLTENGYLTKEGSGFFALYKPTDKQFPPVKRTVKVVL